MVLAFAHSDRYNTRPVAEVSTQTNRNRAWAVVNLANVVANARTIKEAAGGADLLPVVKADAYGLGVEPVVRALETLDPWGFVVATVREGIQLRQFGVRRRVLVLTPSSLDQLETFRSHDLRAVLDDIATIERWDLPFHLEIDTGMGRCGVRCDDPKLGAITSEHLEAAFTHLYAADEAPETVPDQWVRFTEALARLPQRPRLLHAANSAGAWRLGERLDLVRPGIFMYGGRVAADLPVPKPAIALYAPIVSLRDVTKGSTVSYGGDWIAPYDTTVATLGIGYADGVRRSVYGKARVLLDGRRYPIVGRVTMDFVMVDLGQQTNRVRVGDPATLIGRAGGDEITLDEFATWAGTITYEILTGLGARLLREYSK